MSANGPRREVAFRVFASEFDDATYTYAESDEERAPNYVVTPTGARVNRLFVVGVLTEVEQVSDDVVRARVVDPTGAFVIYAGQYQPDALAFFERAEPPMFVALTGKARTFQPDGSDRVFTSIRPESVNEVDADTRDHWVVQTAEHTLERVAVFGKALDTDLRGADLQDALVEADVQPGIAAGIPRAIEEYGTTRGYLAAVQRMAIDAARVVAGEVEEVERTEMAPDEGGDGELETGFAEDVDLEAAEPTSPETEPSTPEAEAQPETGTADVAETEAVEAGDESSGREEPETADVEAETDEVTETDVEAGTDVETETDVDDETAGEDEVTDVEADQSEQEAEAETDEMYELSEEERAEVHENFDVGFESGAELSRDEDAETTADTGETSVEPSTETDETEETPESDESEEVETLDEAEEKEEVETDETEEVEASDEIDETEEDETDDVSGGDEPIEEDELEDVVIETMKAEAGEDGIRREALIEAIESEYAVDTSAVEDAIESALLGGRCFESGEDMLKPI